MYDMNVSDYIPKPCNENWNEMSGDERRKFCDKCSSTVYDLTDQSYDEIAALKKDNGGNLCGAFDVSRFRKPIILGAGISSLVLSACSPSDDKDSVVGEDVDARESQQLTEGNPFLNQPKNPKILGVICLPPPRPIE